MGAREGVRREQTESDKCRILHSALSPAGKSQSREKAQRGRAMLIVSGAGDARDVNAATHIIDPWPRDVGNRNPGNGERMSVAIKRYRSDRPHSVPCPIEPVFDLRT